MGYKRVIFGIRTFVLSWIMLLLSANLVHGFRNGAGGCAGGMPAVGGYHLDTADNRTVNSGDFAEAGIVVTLNGTVLSPNTTGDSNIPQFETGQDWNLKVEVMEISFRGILVRMEAPIEGTLTPGPALKIAEVCELPIIGTTHTDNSNKQSVESTVRFDEPVENVIFDITVVFLNGPIGSVYVYDRFLVNFIGSSVTAVPTTPTPSVITPVPSIAATTMAPSFSPTTIPPAANSTAMPSTNSPTGTPSTLVTDKPTTVEEETTAPSGVVVTEKPTTVEEETTAPSKGEGPTESKPQPSKGRGGKSPKGSTSNPGKGSGPKGDIGNDPSRSKARDKKKKETGSARQLRSHSR